MSSTPSQAPAPQPIDPIMQAQLGYMASIGLWIAAKLRIAEQLATGPKSVDELAKASGANPDRLYRTLRAIATMGIFREQEGGGKKFANTPASEFLIEGSEGNVRDMVLWCASPFHLKVYSETMHSVMTGEIAINHIYKKPIFELFSTPEMKEDTEYFNNCMTSISQMVMPAVLEAYDFSGIGTLVDVAGGHGFVLGSILQKYPHMQGVLFDMEHVIAGSGPLLKSMGVESRVKTATGDFFKSVPPGGDAYIMKHIIHDWEDDKAAVILNNIREQLAMKGSGKVILIEAVITPGSQPHFAKWIDIEMFMMPGGRERTEAEFAALFGKCGFKLSKVVPTKSPMCVVEAVLA